MAGSTDIDAAITIDLSTREQRLYDRLRAQVAPARTGGRSGVMDLVLLLPDLAVLLFRLARDPRVPPGSKVIAVLAASYVVSPIDLIPEIFLGPIAFLDDLFIVGSALSRMLNHVHPDVVRGHWSGQGDALDAIQRVTSWIEEEFTSKAQALWRRVSGGTP